ncbi:MAG: prepilin-type N-terminal cleavage/methylation domain-containing protein [Smithellaceae bacterium]|jgi:prepilin-type N-terminal cleavage/methylation domain-containing protein
MNTDSRAGRCIFRPRAGFTIVELLTVIAIIAILAAMLLVVLSRAGIRAQETKAKLEANDIARAIEKFDSDYGQFPVSSTVQTAAGTNDFTYGSVFQTPAPPSTLTVGTPVSGLILSNAEVIAILMDVTNYPNGQPVLANLNYQKNPQHTIFLSPKMSGYDPSVPGPPEGGVDVNGVYRDPWGNPYVISMDLNYDENCKDSFYCLNKVSGASGTSANPGLNGLINPDNTADNFQYHGKVMVWSAGPDGRIDPMNNANTGANKDNVVSWQ